MLNFPLPYPDELLYSTIARAGTHFAITSPKQLLDEVFGNRKVIATIDFPNHLLRLTQLLPQPKYDLEALAYQHTLFPLYAIFIPEDRRQHCLQWMQGRSQGSIHLALGVAASRIRQLDSLRYCPLCLNEQVQKHGEFYWSRIWQIRGADCCLKHGSLLNAKLENRTYHRHQFVPSAPEICPLLEQSMSSPLIKSVTEHVCDILKMPSSPSADFDQWTAFYIDLAREAHCLRGEYQIEYDEIRTRICAKWPKQWLLQNNLHDLESESSWLKTIFRKHRKSFSYLEHIVVLDALQQQPWDFTTILAKVKDYRKVMKISDTSQITEPLDSLQLSMNKNCWKDAIKKYGIQQSRQEHGALYAWLYRHDKVWLLQQNQLYHAKPIPQGRTVDWGFRDRAIVKRLIQIRDVSALDLSLPRWSKRWLLAQIKHSKSIEKNLKNLPITRKFLDKYSEDIGCYQIRRITQTIIELKKEGAELKRWVVLRRSGLSDERMTDETRLFLTQVLRMENEQN